MKYFVVALISAVVFIGICHATNPSLKCREESRAKGLKESCTLHCQYKAYGFVNDKFEIKKKHRNKLAEFLINGNVVDSNKRKKLDNLLQKCLTETKEKHEDEDPSCYITFDYYICINKDHDLIDHRNFILAITALDKTIHI
uniref:14.2 kDa salivary protein n=1 Tax=Phlebotomus duboscqi TaxID=37738 RepID=Q06K32_PHLDU|nr:14.2 kDa salivary protein [Phlebotomus duboscqi]